MQINISTFRLKRIYTYIQKNKKYDLYLFSLILFSVFYYAYRNIVNIPLVSVPDILVPIVSRNEAIHTLLWSWQWFPPLGKGNDVSIGSILHGLMGNPLFVQKLLYMWTGPIMGISFYLLLRYLIASRMIQLFGSISYALSQSLFIIHFPTGTWFWGLLYVTFPLILLYVLKLVSEREHMQNMIKLTFIVGITNIHSGASFVFYAPFIFLCPFIILSMAKRIKSSIFSIGKVGSLASSTNTLYSSLLSMIKIVMSFVDTPLPLSISALSTMSFNIVIGMLGFSCNMLDTTFHNSGSVFS